jgi:TolB protein
MKSTLLILLMLVLVAALAVAGPQKIAFQRRDNIWISNIDGTAAKKIAIGSEPSISSTGTQVAFNTTPASKYASLAKGAPDPDTQIGVVDLGSGKVMKLKDIPSKCSSPVISQDGKSIIFSAARDYFFDLDIVRTDGSGFKVIKEGTEVGHPMYYSPCWAPDGGSIFCHDTKNICRLGLDGAVLAQWDIRKILPHYFYLTGSISVSPDGNRLLISQEYRGDSEAPPPSLWLFDLVTQRAKHLATPKELSVSQACWLDEGHILFQNGGTDESDHSAIYRMSLDGKDLKRVINDGSSPIVSAP